MKNLGKNIVYIAIMVLLDFLLLFAVDIIYLKVRINIPYYYHILSILLIVIDLFLIKRHIEGSNVKRRIIYIVLMTPFNFVYTYIFASFVLGGWGFEAVEYFYIVFNTQIALLFITICSCIICRLSHK